MLSELIFFEAMVVFLAVVCLMLKLSDDKCRIIVASASLVCALFSCNMFVSNIYDVKSSYTTLLNLFFVYGEQIDIGIFSDSLSITGACLISVINCMVHYYAIGYLKKNICHFFVIANAFTLVFLFFISSHNLLQMYVFWELLSVVGYFLAIYHDGTFENFSDFKLITNHKFADIGFLIGIILINKSFGSFNLEKIDLLAMQTDMVQLKIISALILVSIFMKSAQFMRLNSWAMKIPTTNICSVIMIVAFLMTSGIFVLIRLQNVFECGEFFQLFIVILSIASSFFGCISALKSQNIIHIITAIACMYISSIIMACGFSAYGSAVIMLVTYVFSFSALLCVSGILIHALSGECLISKMGGLLNLLPKTYYSFVSVIASIVGIPLLSSYYAQKVIINDIIDSDISGSYIGIIGIVLNSFFVMICIFRLMYHVFHKNLKLDERSVGYINEDNDYMLYTTYVSILFATLSGVIFYYLSYYEVVWKDVFVFSETIRGYVNIAIQIVNTMCLIIAAYLCKVLFSGKLSYKNEESKQLPI